MPHFFTQLALLGALLTLQGAEIQSQGTLKARSISVDQGSLTVSLEDLPAAAHWIVEARVAASKFGNRAVVATVRQQRPGAFTPMMPTDWPANQLSIGPGSLAISGLSGVTDGVVIFLELTEPVKLTVKSGGQTVLQTAVDPGIVFEDGKLVPEAASGLSHALMRARSRSVAIPDIQMTPAGSYGVSTPYLKSHTTALTIPVHPGLSSPGCCGSSKSATVVFRIDESGRVSDIISRRGDQAYTTAIEQAVRQWKFSPFHAGGKVVPVVAGVTAGFRADGSVYLFGF